MGRAGAVVNATIFEDGKGRSKGSGIVQYSTAEEANYAINSLNETNLGTRNIIVREDRKGGGGGKSGGGGGGFGKGGGGFGKGGGFGGGGFGGGGFGGGGFGGGGFGGGYGKGDGFGKGYGKDFGGFGKSKGKGKDWDRKGGNKGKDDGVRANPEDQGKLVRVGNLPFSTVAQDLKAVFAGFGNIVSCDIPANDDGSSKGFGIVLFETEDAAEAAIEGTNEQEFQGRHMKVRLYNIR